MKGVLAMPLSMTLEPVQKQQLTQHLIQQMNLLQMTSEELDAFVAREVEQNPILDFPEERETWREEGPEWRRMHLRARDPSDDPPSSPVENAHALEMTLEAFLDDQIGCLSLSPLEARLAYFIAGTLDPSGYWREDPVAVAERFDATEEVVLAVLQQVQHLEPCGVAARSLKECLLMQLAQQKGDTSLAQKIIEEGLDDLARNRIPQLASRFNVTKEAILAARDLIRSLNPKPGTAFSEAGPVEFLHEDAFVKTTEKGLKITLSTSYGRTLVINKGYLSILDHSDRPKVKEYLKKELKRAKELQALLKSREDTLAVVLDALATHQERFFRYGPGHKVPLKLADLADDTGFAISTISRALSHKVIACRWGAYPADAFLVGTAAKASEEKGTETTDEALELALQSLIDDEDKHHPLSDQTLCDKLNAMGIPVARRTVNKYRTKLGIPGKSARKVW